MIDFVGWLSAAILLATISRQVYTQWKERTSAGISRWLFIGQVAASAGFVVYSYLLHNWVFVVTNSAILIAALVGQYIYARNKHRRVERRIAHVIGEPARK